ncbi:hypothetical protein [Alcaligenes phenolicus]|uniref:hypothetical protein n=1 Tax=Alcaligenes phenolicus TaxID=232846 RepID=UPI002AA83ABE|nr:hypothetical protein [Alcaligenes phenolicus]
MIITLKLNPQIPSGEVLPLVVERLGEALVINGEVLDLSFMSVGDSLPPGSIDHPLLASATIERDESGFLIDGLLFHIAADQTDLASCFPEPVVIVEDGIVPLPAQSPPPPPPTPEPCPDLEPGDTHHIESDDEHQD